MNLKSLLKICRTSFFAGRAMLAATRVAGCVRRIAASIARPLNTVKIYSIASQRYTIA